MMAALVRHLIESTAFAALAAIFPYMMRKRSAASRHGIWLVAAAKFAIPAAIFSFAGLELHRLIPAHSDATLIQSGWPILISSLPVTAVPSPITPAGREEMLFLLVWFCGLIGMLAIRLWRMRPQTASFRFPDESERKHLQSLAARIGIHKTVSLRLAKAHVEPGVTGLLRQTITVPEDLSSSLEPSEWDAVLLHELAHVKRRDNLSAAFAQLLTCIFWFHPLLWWIERRLIAEQERACDEMALSFGATPADYMSGLFKVCRLQLAEAKGNSCGIAGSSLKKRMEAIMTFQQPQGRMERMSRILIGGLASIMIVVPFLFGLFLSPNAVAQKPMHPASTRVSAKGAPTCVMFSKYYPQGTIIIFRSSTHKGPSRTPPQMCSTDIHGNSIWTRNKAAIRAHGRKIVMLPPLPPPLCKPITSPFAKYCACQVNTRAMGYSPGAIVFSPQGPLEGWLACRQNQWRPFPPMKNAPPPKP